MIVKLKVEEPKIVFDPPFRECRDIILRCFSEIIASGEGLPRVRVLCIPKSVIRDFTCIFSVDCLPSLRLNVNYSLI